MNRVRFTGRIGRKTLAPGTYRLTARPTNRPEETRRVVVIVGAGPRERLDCASRSNPFALLGGASFFGEGGGDSASGGVAISLARPAEESKSRGVLPAISRKIRNLPKALPPLPRPDIPGDGASPPGLLALAALVLLALSGFAILAYVIRFVRGPHAT